MAKRAINVGAKSNYLSFASEMFMGVVAGAGVDAFVEVTKFPVLNDQAPVGGPGMTNYEMVAYGIGILASSLGLLSLVTGKGFSFGGVGKELFSSGIGVIVGTHLYENWGAQKLGIR